MPRFPTSFIVLFALGLATAVPGILSLIGAGERLHPVLADPMAGLAFLVSAIALIGSACFPLIIARIARGDEAAAGHEGKAVSMNGSSAGPCSIS